jgi:putative restriction endonuclease
MIAIAATDLDWFEVLSGELTISEVNFWTPTPWNISRLKQGDKFYFLLKAPYRMIGGYGYFSYYENMSAREAWNRFGIGNGVDDLTELVARTSKYADRHSTTFVPTENPEIGCIVLDRPIFLEESQFFRPEDYGKPFPRQVVKLKYFDDDFDIGRVTDPEQPVGSAEPFQLVVDRDRNYKSRRMRDRVGQASFRQKVLAAYGYKCCVTGESCLEVLDAAHIQPYVNGESNHVQNGLALRTDLHKLFDSGLITITSDYRLRTSDRLNSEFYVEYHDREVSVPHEDSLRPSQKALEMHGAGVFRS